MPVIGTPSYQTIMNGTSNANIVYAMPQKDITSDGDSGYALARRDYRKTSTVLETPTTKKWYGSGTIRDASHIIEKNRTVSIGQPAAQWQGFQTKNNINVRNDALLRCRNQGYVTDAKVRAKIGNNLTPAFALGTLVRTINQAPVSLLNFPLWKSKGDVICDVSLAGNCYNIYYSNPSPTIYH